MQRLFRRAGGRTWHCHFYVDGKRMQRSTRCIDREAAEQVAARFEREANGATPEGSEWLRGPATSFVYFVQAEQNPKGPVKIGRASAPSARLVRVQSGSHEKLKILCAIPGASRLERLLHKTFAEHRLEGEWFKAT